MVNRAIRQGVSLLLISAQAAWAMPVPSLEIRPQSEIPAFLQIEIPDTLATLEEVYEAPPSLNPKVVLQIQNIHGHYQAQVQVKKMLEYFYKQYGFKTVFVEGAVEKLDPSYLQVFPDAKENNEMADQMARNGQLTGPELYLMEAPEDVQAIGIERTDLYRGNYEAFKQVYGAKSQTDSFIRLLDSRLELLSSRFLTRDMRRVLSEWQKFHDGRREFLPFIKHLAGESAKFLNLDLHSLFAQVEWPQTARLLVLQSMEADIKQELAMTERGRLLEFLKEHGASAALISGIESMEEKTVNMQRLSKGKGEDLYDPRKLLERLAGEAAGWGFQFHQYPNFSLYAGYLILQSELDSKVLFQEIEKLFERILDSLTVSEKEKNLLELYKDLELFKKLLALELTRTEMDQVTYRKNWIKPESLVERLEKMSADGFVTEELKLKRKTAETFEEALKFYDFARQREFAFYDVIEREMAAQKTDRAILVTGGFHTDGLTEIFRSKQMNYGVLTPRIGGEFDKTNYVHTLMETHPTRFDLAQMEMINAMQSIAAQVQMGADPVQLVQSRLEYLNRILEKLSRDPDVAALGKNALNKYLQSFIERTQYQAEGAGFQRLPDDGDGILRYWYRAPLSIENGKIHLGPLTNKKGEPLLFLLNPNFTNGQALIVNAVSVDFLESIRLKKDSSGKSLPPLNLSINLPASPETTQVPQEIESGGVRALIERVQFTLQAPVAVELPSFGDAKTRLAPVSEKNRSVLFPTSDRRLTRADRLLQEGQNPADVVNALTATVTSSSFETFVRELTASAASAEDMDGLIDELASAQTIPQEHAAVLKLLFKKSAEPGAMVQVLKTLPEKTDDRKTQLKTMAEAYRDILQENPKQYITLVLPSGVTIEAVEDIFQSVERSELGPRFQILSPDRLNASDVFRLMISLMQRMGDLKRGSLFNHIEQHGILYSEENASDVDTLWIDFYARFIDQGSLGPNDARLSADKGIRSYAEVLTLGAWMSSALSRMGAEEIDQNLLEFLQRREDKRYRFKEDALLGLVASLMKVLQARTEIGKSA